MTASAPIFQVFSYSEFPNQNSAALAKDTFADLVGFARNYFDGLVKIGGALCNVLEEILKTDSNGKKVFSKWLGSFGALEYLARNAIDIYNWFKALDPELQQELRENVQSLKISALRELRYLTPEELKEFITSGFRTAKQIKQLHTRSTKKAVKNTNGAVSYQNNDLDSFEAIEEQPVVEVIESECDVELTPGMRVVVKNANWWDGATGEIKSTKKEDEFWVLLDSQRDLGRVTESLFKRSQLEPEEYGKEMSGGSTSPTQTLTNSPTPMKAPGVSKKMYSESELQVKIAEALAQKEKELEEEKIGRFAEVEEAAKKSAGAELDSYKQRTISLEQQKQELLKQVDAKEQELRKLRSLESRNEQLEQRVEDLEKICDNSNKNPSNVNHQVTKQPEKDLVLLLPRLMSEAHELRGVVSMQEEELAQLRVMNLKQQEEIKEWRQYSDKSVDIEEIVKEFGTLGESIGWNGWNRHGYRAADGTLHRDIDAITNFISDFRQKYYEETSLVFH